MAELNTAEELDDIYEMEYCTDAITGGQDKRMYLYYQLINGLKQADSVDIVVSFLMESGVRMLLSELENALKHGAKIRILKVAGLGDWSSIIEKCRQCDDMPCAYDARSHSGELKVTKESFKAALWNVCNELKLKKAV